MKFDPVTEAIAHFIGYFQLRVEEARHRDQYDPFKNQRTDNLQPELQHIDVKQAAPYVFKDFEPGVIFKSQPDEFETVPAKVRATDGPALQPWWPPGFDERPDPWFDINQFGGDYDFNQPPEHRLLPPGSTAVVVSQHTHLEDNDYLTMVERAVATKSFDEANDKLDLLIAQAESLQRFKAADHPSDEAALGTVIETLANKVTSFDSPATEGVDAHVFKGNESLGIHVNGETATVVPDLNDYLNPDTEPESEAEPQSEVQGVGAVIVEVSTEYNAGNNVLINEALLGSSWTVSPVVAAQGDYISINLISQVNVWHDTDNMHAEFASWPQDGEEPTLAFNIASFTQPMAPASVAEDSTATFPQSWNVTTITGNLIFLNWIEQINFVMDQDIAVLSNSGSSSYIEMGGNLTVNSLSLLGLGQYFDLILIDGQFYDANVILQKNILFDDDDLSIEDGLSMGGSGSVSGSGNLLWNQATINVKGAINTEALPQDYATALQMLAQNDESAINALLSNLEFAGLSHLRILHVEGSIFDLQYIEQTNVLGDADQVVVAAEQAQATLSGDWTVLTGANALANIASITDAGPDSTIYVGGDIYSDALLYQAEFVPTDEALRMSASNDLASEAVIFLASDILETTSQADDGMSSTIDNQNSASPDVMQTMTG
jgi:hypothetical protein